MISVPTIEESEPIDIGGMIEEDGDVLENFGHDHWSGEFNDYEDEWEGELNIEDGSPIHIVS